jgi:ATP/maltotriose-dependent transcriptional regulator MalT
LKAIALFRFGDENWKVILEKALKQAEYYNYCALIAKEGAAVEPLLKEYDRLEELRPEFVKHMMRWVGDMSRYYPGYLRQVELPDEKFTEKELQVIRHMCDGLSSADICEELHISYNGLKFHKKNIYRKLDVNSLQQAVNKARSLGLNAS